MNSTRRSSVATTMVAGAAAQADGRVLWLDTAKGIGILLVVFGHVWRGLDSAGLIAPTGLFERVDEAIYAFHMPLFFLLSGLIFRDAVLKRDLAGFLGSRVVRLLYPLVIWTYVFVGFRYAASSMANADVGLDELLSLPLPPKAHFWFLWALFLIQAGCATFRGIVVQAARPQWVWSGLLVLSIGLYMLRPETGLLAEWADGALRNLPYFLLGVVLTDLARTRLPVLALPLGLLAFGFLQWIVVTGNQTRLQDLAVATGLILSLAAILIALEGWPVIARGLGPLRFVGLGSMAIFVAHVIFTAATRIVLDTFGVADLTVHVVLGTTMGVLCPLAMWVIAERFRVDRVLGL